jgi:hypothetical protein
MSRQVVHNWVHENRPYLQKDFIHNDATRVSAMRQFGELNEKVMNKDGSINMTERNTYLAKNADKYPSLNSNPQQPKVPDEKQATDVREPYTRQPVVNPPRQQSQRVQQQPQQQRSQPSAQPYNNIQRAQSYHSNGWQQTEPTYHAEPQRSAPSYSPPARSAPSYSAPARSAPAPSGGGRR